MQRQPEFEDSVKKILRAESTVRAERQTLTPGHSLVLLGSRPDSVASHMRFQPTAKG